MENENKNNQLQIELKEEVAQGTYANLAIITHSTSEFVVDFVRIMPGLPKAGVQSRIVMTPEHAKRLMYALQDNVAKFEKEFGDRPMAQLPQVKFVKEADMGDGPFMVGDIEVTDELLEKLLFRH